ncbi:MAG: PilZ domain-containing protein [Planctomycetota bacterium]|nr:PilZ domain-containing protein [Planctomycetota bacterium]
MRTTSQRRAKRIPCRIPIRIFGRHTDLDGTLHDISRLGARLRVPLDAYGRVRTDNILRLGQLVEQHLGGRFNADLNQDELGSLVRKRMRVVRIGQERIQGDLLEVGCEFGIPLTGEEVRALQIELPMPVRASIPFGPETATPKDDACLLPTEGWSGGILTGHTRVLGEGRAVFQASRTSHLVRGEHDLTALTIALAKAYGPAPVLEAVDGHHQLWVRKTRIRRVEATEYATGLRVQLETCHKGRQPVSA